MGSNPGQVKPKTMKLVFVASLLWASRWLLLNGNKQYFSYIHDQNKLYFDDDDIQFVLNQNAEFDFNSTSSLKQRSEGRHVKVQWLERP
jgi:hypothetical protein